MNINLQFDFLVDKKANTITMMREFAANRQLVWDAHTRSELLEQWFAPKPFTAKTRSMDFREGGHWLYAMVAPDGKEHWGRTDYLKIKPIDFYTALDGFCDENGVPDTELPRAGWEVVFEDLGENSMVKTVITYSSLSDLETVIKMGMKQGITMAFKGLDDLLINLRKQQ